MLRILVVALSAAIAAGCAHSPSASAGSARSTGKVDFVGDAYPSTYRSIAAAPVLISNATVLIGNGQRLEGTDLLMRDGRLEAFGSKEAVRAHIMKSAAPAPAPAPAPAQRESDEPTRAAQ